MEEKDEKLIREAKEDIDNFGKIYRKYADKVYNYLFYRVGRDKDAAEDLRQETFLRALKNFFSYEIKTPPYLGYLITISHNLLVNYYRKVKEISIYDIKEPGVGMEKEIEAKERRRIIRKALQNLPKTQKRAIILKYERGLSVKEIAERMKKSENAVKLLLSRGRKALARDQSLKY